MSQAPSLGPWISPEGKKPMGAGCRTEHINLIVKPTSCSVQEFSWPAFTLGGTTTKGYKFNVMYSLGGDAAKGLHGAMDGCKKPLPCPCPTEGEGGSSAPRERKRTQSEAFEARQAGVSEAHQAYFEQQATIYQRPCRWLHTGTCVKGALCKFVHGGGPTNWETIPCMNKKGASGNSATAESPHSPLADYA